MQMATVILTFAAPIFLSFVCWQAKRYADAHKGTMRGNLAAMIVWGIEQKYGKSLPNDQKKALAERAMDDKNLQKDLLTEGSVAVMNEAKKASQSTPSAAATSEAVF
jgi:hypothetical protein